MTFTRIFLILAALAALPVAIVGAQAETTSFCADVDPEAGMSEAATEILSFPLAAQTIDAEANDYYACMVTSQGVIELTLFDDDAPESVNNFVFLASQGFYDGVIFHRVVDEFVVQGGDRNSAIVGNPVGTGSAGYAWSLEEGALELPHLTGTLAQARAQSPDSNGSQFYITLAPQPPLDGQYNVYGEVSGENDMEIVQSIAQGDLIRTVQVIQVNNATGEISDVEPVAPPEQPVVEDTNFCADVAEDAGTDEAPGEELVFDAAEFVIEPETKDYYACVVTSQGIIELTLFDDLAPESVNNFVFLAQQGFYDGVQFHRVVDEFVIQGGDRNSLINGDPLGTGGPGYTWSLEPGALAIQHEIGTLAQARAQSPDSNGSQFYITLSATPNLNGQYNAYGRVSGENHMEIVEAVAEGDILRTVIIIEVDVEDGA
ncbi:MAG: peptidylprolyl isomerase [Chloroflexota bacterium]